MLPTKLQLPDSTLSPGRLTGNPSLMSSHDAPVPEGGFADGVPEFGWFCLRSQPKHEHIAARHLERMGVEVLNPRIRFQRVTRHGPVQVTEAMFPNYLFARF